MQKPFCDRDDFNFCTTRWWMWYFTGSVDFILVSINNCISVHAHLQPTMHNDAILSFCTFYCLLIQKFMNSVLWLSNLLHRFSYWSCNQFHQQNFARSFPGRKFSSIIVWETCYQLRHITGFLKTIEPEIFVVEKYSFKSYLDFPQNTDE